MTTKDIKQQDLLGKQKKATKKTTPMNGSLASLKSFQNSQDTEKVTYNDANGKEHSKKVTFTDPGIGKSAHAITLINSNSADDKIDLYKLIMKHVIVEPKMSLEKEAKNFPKSLKTRVITTQTNKYHEKVALKNKSGQKVQINLKWPGYYVALRILYSSVNVDGSLKMETALNMMNSYVFKDDDGKGVTDAYWDAGGHCYGLGLYAIGCGITYITQCLDNDGFNSIIQKGISFLPK